MTHLRWGIVCGSCISLAVLLGANGGCSRNAYRVRADLETAGVLHEKNAHTPWAPPEQFTIYPHPDSRFFDPTNPNDPLLPVPAPKLHAYEIPRLPERDPERFGAQGASGETGGQADLGGSAVARKSERSREELPSGERAGLAKQPALTEPAILDVAGARPVIDSEVAPELVDGETPFVSEAETGIAQVAYAQPLGIAPAAPAPIDLSLSADEDGVDGVDELPIPGGQPAAGADGATTPGVELEVDERQRSSPYAAERDQDLVSVPVPEEVWESLPPSCLERMFEFASIREEYRRSTGSPAPVDDAESRRLSLEDIVELSLINSREYQRQKELLYSAALRVTIERFAYDMKFSPFGNGTDVNYLHNRVAGTTTNTLAVPSRLQAEQILATGGDFVARFANDVLLTFNGPNGFAADVGSDIFLQMTQSVFQRDVVFERLTQSERNLVYTARDFARFRKILFRDLALQYYALLLTYRDIEIQGQGYFTNLRAFNQGQAEYRAGRLPRIQVDQFEQDALRARSTLIGRCNSLERGFDLLKFAVGLPPELPINLDLTELEILTLRDEITVSAELVRRARRSLVLERQVESPDRRSLLNFAIDLTRRMLNLADLRAQIGQQQDVRSLELLLAEFLVAESLILTELNREILEEEQQSIPPPPPLRIFQRTTELIDSLLVLVERRLDLDSRSGGDDGVPDVADSIEQVQDELARLRTGLDEAIENRELEQIPLFVMEAQQLLLAATSLTNQVVPPDEILSPEEQLQSTLDKIDRLLLRSRETAATSSGLTPIEIAGDEAMLTALVQRFDLMNQRGILADAWRQIKLAGDDLKSVLNLSASQSIRTDSTKNEPFNFSFDDSATNLRLSFDAPLNRKAQRNDFRLSLIDYQVSLRNLIELEDRVKLDIRDDLRSLQLDREQYAISVASAALAYERVVSTRLQLQLGVENVAARDFLEAQQAYTASLSNVAEQHIGYITDRIQLFLNLELLQVDETGFWPELYDEASPEPNLVPPAGAWPPYGELPGRVWYSHRLKRMYDVPPGHPTIYKDEREQVPTGGRAEPEDAPESLPQPLEGEQATRRATRVLRQPD